MEMELIMQMVSSIGFPISMCILMAWYVKYQAETHKAEVDSLRQALENNTEVLIKLTDKLEGIENV